MNAMYDIEYVEGNSMWMNEDLGVHPCSNKSQCLYLSIFCTCFVIAPTYSKTPCIQYIENVKNWCDFYLFLLCNFCSHYNPK